MLIHNKGNYIRVASGVRVVPGTNTLSDEDWKSFSSHPLIEKLIEKNEIELKESEGNKSDKLSADEKIELAKDTHNLEALEDMREGEDRKTVLKAIDDQIELLKDGDGSEQE